MNKDEINKVKKSINMIDDFVNQQIENKIIEPVQCNPLIMKNILKYISYLENQIELDKIVDKKDYEDQMNILFIKGHYPELIKSLRKADGYDFGNEVWTIELIKPINKITSLKGTLYEIISALEKVKELNSKKKGK